MRRPFRAHWGAVALLPLFCGGPQTPRPEPAAEGSHDGSAPAAAYAIPGSENLFYRVEWRLIHAGNARLTWSPSNGAPGWAATLKLESVGLVSRLYKVDSEYSLALDGGLCAVSSFLKANEGSKHRETRVTYDREQGKASYLERDVVKNTIVGSHELDIPGCVYDVVGALYRLRTLRLETGGSAQLPVSDGKKSVLARVEAQEREVVRVGGLSHKTVRYEAFLFNNVLYRRRGRLFVWLTDDEQRLPVQIRLRLPFYIGTVTLQLTPEKKKA